MNGFDLTPSSYQQHRKIRTARVAWIVAVGVCAVVSLIPVFLEMTRVPDPAAARAREQIALSERQLAQNNAMIESISGQLNIHKRELQAIGHLTDRPDWRRVLELIGGEMTERLMLTDVRLGGVSDMGVRNGLGRMASSAPGDSTWLILNGVAESNTDVPGLVLRLESLGLFEQVVMTETWREPHGGDNRIGFRLACRVD